MNIGGIRAKGYIKFPQISNSNLNSKKPENTAEMPKKPENKDAFEFTMTEKEREKAEMIKQKQEEAKLQQEQLKSELESSNMQAKEFEKSAKVQSQCMLIASRIMAGDDVPIQDYKYLATNNTELYGKAIMMRVNKENPEKHKRVSEDEEETEPTKLGDFSALEMGEQAPEVSEVSAESISAPATTVLAE